MVATIKDDKTASTNIGTINGYTVTMALYLIIQMFGGVSGACFNPTACIALTFFGNQDTADST